MDKYKSLLYSYNKRTKRYTILINNSNKIYDGIKSILGRSRSNIVMIKVKPSSFEVREFFLLEFLYTLENILNERPDKAMDIGGITLHDLIDFLKEKTWLSDRYTKNVINIFDMQNVSNMLKFQPLPHHLDSFKKYEEIKKLANLRGMMMHFDAGTGKTYGSLALGEALDYNNFLIIAPNNTIDDVWVKSITKELYRSPQPYYIYNSKNKDYKKERFMIMNYESITKLVSDKRNMRLIKKLKPILIVDEFHNFNNIKALRSSNLTTLVNKIDFNDIVLLTGTPIKMAMKELEPMLYILDRKFPPIVDMFIDFYKGNGDLFRNRFEIYKHYAQRDLNKLPKINIEELRVKIDDEDRFLLSTINKEIDEFKTNRLEELYNNMDMYESTYEDLLNKVYMSMLENKVSKTEANKSIKEYKKLVKIIRKYNDDKKLYAIPNIIVEARELEKSLIFPNLTSNDVKTFKDIRSIIKYPELKVLGEALGRILLRKRIDCYNELANNLDYKNLLMLTDKKGVVFSNYVSTCSIAIDKLIKQGYNPVGVYGDDTDKLPIYVKKFNDLEDPTNPIVATYKSLSTGVPLIAGNVMIMLDIPVRLYLAEQAISRVYRIGQDKPVMVFMIKLDTGNKFNITDRDHFILNLSTRNVELLTGVKTTYEIPEQLLESEVEEDDNNKTLIDIEDEIKKDIKHGFMNSLDNNIISLPIDYVTSLIKKIKIKL